MTHNSHCMPQPPAATQEAGNQSHIYQITYPLSAHLSSAAWAEQELHKEQHYLKM